MTRLTEALERAHLETASVPPAAPSADEVLRTWHFDTEAAAPAPAKRTLPKKSLELTGDFQFTADIADKVVVGPLADAGLVEQYRRVAAALHHAQAQRGARSVMIASAVAAEGKTLTTTNLALTLSVSFDRRVLLIDADLRRPSVHTMFRLANQHGLVDNLRNPDGGRLPVHRMSPNLWVLTAGQPTSDPMSGLVSETMKQLLADAAQQFDWVVIDTPPVALMPDANLLAGMVDSALLVIRAGTTPYPLVQRAAAAIGPDRILGVVLNRADHAAHSDDYGYYGYYDRAPRGNKPAGPARRLRLFGGQ
jgi:capsular exopolysaccharide synthesis family protein